MTPHRILVTGATGFLGSHVTDRLLAAGPDRARLRILVHRRPGPAVPHDGVEIVTGSLTEPSSLHGVCDGVTTVLHLAARIGGTEEECHAVNSEGTRALLAEAARAGVRNVVQLGTAAVYGDGPHRGEPEGALTESPVSPTSRTRLAAERQVLAADGLVLRPHLIYGRGDTWVLPAVVDLLRRLPHWVDGGAARLSLVSADALAGALAELALLPEPPHGQVLHAAHPEPVTARDLVTSIAHELGLPLPQGELTLDQALARLGATHDPVTRRRLSLLAVDHFYDSGRLWKLVDAPAGPGFPAAFPQYAPWYRGILGPR